MHAPLGYYASTAVAIPGRDGGGGESEARTGNSAPMGRPGCEVPGSSQTTKKNGSKKQISIFRTRPPHQLDTVSICTSRASKKMDKPSESRISWANANLEVKLGGTLTLAKNHCMRQTRVSKIRCAYYSTRSRRDSGRNSKLPTFQQEIHIEIVYTDQGENS